MEAEAEAEAVFEVPVEAEAEAEALVKKKMEAELEAILKKFEKNGSGSDFPLLLEAEAEAVEDFLKDGSVPGSATLFL